jgi:hypothetical protein
MDPTAENLRAVILTLAFLIGFLCLVVIQTVDCDPECEQCKAKRKKAEDLHLQRYFGPSMWCSEHRCLKATCQGQHRP